MDIIEIIYMICFFCIGTLFGSFFSLAIYRIPRKQDIMIKRSYCPKCKHDLEFFDLIPIISYIIRLGKCNYCNEKISFRYFVLEIFNGLLFLGIYIVFENNLITYIIIFIYIILFVIIGSTYMKSKMSEEEITEVKKINKKSQEGSINNKKGVFNVELIIAMFAFAIYFTVAIYMSRNYRESLLLATMKSLAFNIASNKLETTKSLEYDNVSNINLSEETSDGYSFSSEITVNEYVYDRMGANEKYAKKITSIVTYKYGNKEYEVKLEDIKNKRGGV